jgi:hypothetical protein
VSGAVEDGRGPSPFVGVGRARGGGATVAGGDI